MHEAVLTRNRWGQEEATAALVTIAHRLCRLIWKILHQGVRYQERGPTVSWKTKQRRTTRMIRELRSLGYRVQLANPQSAVPV